MDPEAPTPQPTTYDSSIGSQKELQPTADVSKGPSPIEKVPVEIIAKIFILCRDDVLDDKGVCPKSILNSHHAPLLLCQISPGWRQLAQNTPRLWDIIPLVTSDLVSDDTMPAIRTLFGRSRNLPLGIIVENTWPWARISAPVPGNRQFLLRLRELHDRFEHLQFKISSSDVVVDYLPPSTTLPLLRSLDIYIWEQSNTSAVLPVVLSIFRDAPSLRVLRLAGCSKEDLISHIFTSNFFPWHQLTTLTSWISVSTTIARDILRLCPRLQMCKLGGIETSDVRDQPPLCILDQMCSLDLGADSDGPFAGFLESLAFPGLETLILSYFAVPGHSLLQLHNRSQFQLRHLEIEWSRFTAEQIIQLLRLLPDLETLSLNQWDGSGDLFKAFTYRGATACAPLTLLHLVTLKFRHYYIGYEHIDPAVPGNAGNAIIEMAESLGRYPTHLNLCFPSLRTIALWLHGPKFPGDIEDRLAAACSRGPVVDLCVDERE
ncbi:hypothetical protein B0H19DRAFT_1129165 [Mycena capillaripes]|nr:hypothetical protein B0H19DRAFT_1129165 [Mycena capillaripes]